MDAVTIMAVAGPLLGGGGVWAFMTSWRDRKAVREESEIGRLRVDVDALRQRDKECHAALAAMGKRVLAMEQAQDSQIARWTKDTHKRITWLNAKALFTIFGPLGYAREDVEGKTFAELDKLDPHAVAEIERLDQIALARDGAPHSTLIQFHPMLPEMHVIKLAAMGRDGELVYEGYCYRKNDPDMADAAGHARQMASIESAAERVIDGQP
jgi:hypothetical protein